MLQEMPGTAPPTEGTGARPRYISLAQRSENLFTCGLYVVSGSVTKWRAERHQAESAPFVIVFEKPLATRGAWTPLHLAAWFGNNPSLIGQQTLPHWSRQALLPQSGFDPAFADVGNREKSVSAGKPTALETGRRTRRKVVPAGPSSPGPKGRIPRPHAFGPRPKIPERITENIVKHCHEFTDPAMVRLTAFK